MFGRSKTLVAIGGLAVLCACSGSAPIASIRAPDVGARGEIRVPILMYHHVGPAGKKWRPLFVSLPQFSRQMAAIAKSGVKTLTIDELYRAAREGRSFPDGAVALTFDDGTIDQYQLVFPILKQYRMRATLYVAPGLFGKTGYITWAQAAEMSASKLVAFESHTLTHADLTRVTSDAARAEITEGKRLLEQRLGIRSRHFAYPYGHYDASVLRLVRNAGFLTGVTTKYAWMHDPAMALEWGRLTVHDTNSPSNLASLARSSGAFDAAKSAGSDHAGEP